MSVPPEVRQFWQSAAAYPPNKEGVYPEHAAVQEFDRWTGATVLEYGCGGGADAMSYLRRGCTVIYADVVPENVEAATRRIVEAGLSANAGAVLLTASVPLGFSDGCFDLVNCHGVLHHIEDPAPVVAEFFRVLRPGGHVYVMLYTEWLREHFVRQIMHLKATRGLTDAQAFGWCTDGPGCPYARAYTETEGSMLLEAAAFVVESAVVYNTWYFRRFRAIKP